MNLPQLIEASSPASIAPAHRDDVTIAAACWTLVQEISADGVWNVEVWRNTHGAGAPLAGKQPCCITVFGPWDVSVTGETDSRLFDAATHFDALTRAAEAVRAVRALAPKRVKALGELIEAADNVQCGCTAKQQAAGHKPGCWYPALSEAIESARKAVFF